ncbi:uncharacterized protein [Nerophis lumbriciformis]|uniref:uncharacterized protein isoform X1 n=1 Tax=Nerophis lumbriciformis TaxID=546530 RepID=UPI002ADFC79D|nr:uncharacterized protein LOC133605664 isoform X1 [Nerophis lumbriciformis]XP_061815818.1 uncharacterized protein LOC133606187 [Nerophis lumbriciformis]
METQDHAYTNTTYDKVNRVELIYKLSPQETEDFVKLRVSNNYLFSGKKNTSMWAWRAIIRHMGFQDRMNHRQASKKWENLRKKYKVLKDQDYRDKWPPFNLMDDAMEGRLEGSAPILVISPQDKGYYSSVPKAKKRRITTETVSPVKVQTEGVEIEVTLNGDGHDGDSSMEEDGMGGSTEFNGNHQDEDVGRRYVAQEQLALQRDRALMERETAVLERDRVLLERERLLIERETAVLARENEMLAWDKKRRKAALGETTPASSCGTTKDDGSQDRRERFLQLFEKLIDSI